jgi:hypothetical protein
VLFTFNLQSFLVVLGSLKYCRVALEGARKTMSALALAVTSTLWKLGNQGPCCCDDDDGSEHHEVGTAVTPVSQMMKTRH